MIEWFKRLYDKFFICKDYIVESWYRKMFSQDDGEKVNMETAYMFYNIYKEGMFKLDRTPSGNKYLVLNDYYANMHIKLKPFRLDSDKILITVNTKLTGNKSLEIFIERGNDVTTATMLKTILILIAC